MLKKWLPFLIILLILITSALTNPSKEEFVSWSEKKLISESHSGVVNLGVNLFGNWVINSVTKTNNYLFFTIYSVDLPNNQHIKVLGIFKQFIPLPENL